MQTVRRLYFYAVAIVSLEVVIWGVIGLGRTIITLNQLVGSPTSQLAGSLALVLVGLPVFIIHWVTAQREALRDAEERITRVRAIFLYGVLLGTLIPIVQNGLALVNRFLLLITRLSWSPLVGMGQTWGDNLIAVMINAAAVYYFWIILRADWKENVPNSSLGEVRRLYRYLWVIYTLGITVLGMQRVLRFILFLPTQAAGSPSYLMVDGLALLLIGTPLWVWTWQIIQQSLKQRNERESLLRLTFLYLMALIGVGTVLTASILVISDLLRWILGESWNLGQFIDAISNPLSIAIPLGGVWGYYAHCLRNELEAIPDHPRKAGFRRLYVYILSAFGLVSTFVGMQQVLSYIITVSVNEAVGTGLRDQLCMAIGTLVVGLPLWWANWRPMQLEARTFDDNGDHARRSVIRKAYLYLALFAGVIGVMVTGGQLIYLLVSRALGASEPEFLHNSLNWLQTLILFGIWLAYHIRTLWLDGRLAGQALAAHHTRFPVLILDEGDGSFGEEITITLRRTTPEIPIAVQLISQGIPGEDKANASVIVMTAGLATQPPEALRLWLENYTGEHLIVPTPQEGWLWVGSTPRSQRDLAQQTAQTIRQLAEGQAVRNSPPATAWTIAGYVLSGLFLLQVLGLVFVLLISLTNR